MKLWKHRKEKYLLRTCPYCGDGLFQYLKGLSLLDLYYCPNTRCFGYTHFFLDKGIQVPRPVLEIVTVYPAQAQRGWEALWDA